MSHMKANFLMLIASLIWGTAFVSQTTGMGFMQALCYKYLVCSKKVKEDLIKFN